MSKTEVKRPRNFILLDCINKVGQYTHVAYGLIDDDDKTYKNNSVKFEYWNGTLMYEADDNINILPITFRCTPNFPKERPIVNFSKESLEFDYVQNLCKPDGSLHDETIKRLPWSETMKLGEYLNQILNLMY